MATARKAPRNTRTRAIGTKASAKSSARKSTPTKTRSRSTVANSRKSTAKKSTAKKSASRTTTAPKARKTGSKTAHGQAWTDQKSNRPSSTGHGKAKKVPAKQNSQCWPGYEPVPGKARGTKGSCKPKAHQTSSEKKGDAMEAAASKLRKTGK